MASYVIARNERTTLYEIHVAGCKHLISRHLEQCARVEGVDMSAADLAAEFERENEDCLTKLGPCAKG